MNERMSDLLAAAAAVVNEWDTYVVGNLDVDASNPAFRRVGIRIVNLDNALHAFPPGLRGSDD